MTAREFRDEQDGTTLEKNNQSQQKIKNFTHTQKVLNLENGTTSNGALVPIVDEQERIRLQLLSKRNQLQLSLLITK